MMENLPTLRRLLKQLQQVPYLASKNLYRVTQHFLELEDEQLNLFCTTLRQAHDQLVKCKCCWVWQEKNGECQFCTNPKRDHSVICVVESWHDLCALERSGGYQGEYHLLGGAICPLDGIGPDDLTINALVLRINESHKEIILAMNQTPEGEATAAFIARKLTGKGITLTCLARGVPVGSSLEFTDRLTVHKALAERRVF
jgi:recombination protein RecR